ncbi:winged helix-turn-helix domain-containing protein [Sphingomonas glacialis]|uniref:OmpR/PhoB-type domain-containing protein n=1 Tax=Sphingomonas glacialis TaxID=658225 RepID=A0A502FSQ1_9SPHN|nr:winged helix-turn-helix domain-containing protein [Sphingomonas glacialis]TPG52617.1 hypothetical protein EAH76_12035 [Sphingomonas glacialis]
MLDSSEGVFTANDFPETAAAIPALPRSIGEPADDTRNLAWNRQTNLSGPRSNNSKLPDSFGDYRVHPCARTLTCKGHAVPIGSRAYDLLIVLLRSRGRLVTKEEIMREVWPATFVDESNLRFQMGCLRKALGSERDRIKTIPGRGYLFVEEEGGSGSSTAGVAAVISRDIDRGSTYDSIILIIEPDDMRRQAIAVLLQALKVSVNSFTTLDEAADFARRPARGLPH